jgi:tetratricopeptide (TPR) repeat protein
MLGPLRFAHLLAILLLVGFAARLAYVLGQAASDPAFALPILDGAYYVEWARSLAAGRAGPLAGHPGESASAFYLAPLYPLFLAGMVRAFGENFALIYYAQQLLVILSAAFLALAGRRLAGEWAGLAAAALWIAYHPSLFFASRPVGEALAIVLLAAALLLRTRTTPRSSGVAGLLCGVATLARPNLLLVAVVWTLDALSRKKWKCAGLILAGVVLALLPTLARNLAVSGHPVPVSANGGMTLYHGNAPGARGIGWFAAGLSGRLSEQQREATRLATFFQGREMDPVEADRWWGLRAVRARLDDPGGSLQLVARRLALIVSNEELSLDYAPVLDVRPWRWLAPLPFALLIGLAGAGVHLRGFAGSGGRSVWGAAAACAVTPLVFYVSSRYRLPLAAVLCIPAGVGLAGLASRGLRARRRGAALAIAAALAALSVITPTGGLDGTSEAAARANRAAAWMKTGHPAKAEADLKRALEIDPDSVPALNRLASLLDRQGRGAEFDEYYRRALDEHPATPAERWTDVVLGRVAVGELREARRAAEQARREGVELEPGLLERIEEASEGAKTR